METSDKHGPRLADDLTKDTRAGHEDRLLDEDEAAAVDGRTELARSLQPSVFPARPDALIESAEQQFAPDAVVESLRALPDRVYENVQQVWEASRGGGLV